LNETIVGLLRHGQTDWNIDFRLQGTTDIPLNETGLAQARAVSQHIFSADWTHVACSPLSRAKDTAQIVADLAGLPEPAIEPLLLERAFGVGEGLTYEEWSQQFKNLAVIPGGESLVELADRVWLLLDVLLENYRGKRVLTVSHGALIRKVIELVSENTLPNAGHRFGNTSLSVIAHTDAKGWHILSYNPHTYQGEPLRKAWDAI
jgi:broad specificity phosphatase PhoE